MNPFKTIFFFAARFAALYALLILAWPLLDAVFPAFMRAGGNILLGNFGPLGRVEFLRFEDGPTEGYIHRRTSHADMKMAFYGAEGEYLGVIDVRSRHLGYLPLATLLALILATPLPWRRRGRALLWGLPFGLAFVFFRPLVLIIEAFTDLGLIWPDAIYWKAFIWRFSVMVVHIPSNWFIAPIVIWALATFRREDYRRLLAFTGAKEANRDDAEQGNDRETPAITQPPADQSSK